MAELSSVCHPCHSVVLAMGALLKWAHCSLTAALTCCQLFPLVHRVLDIAVIVQGGW